MTRLTVASIALLALSTQAFAWTHTGRVWNPQIDFPYQYFVADDGTETTDCEETVPSGYCTTVSEQGYAAWQDAPCADFSYEYLGLCVNSGYTTSDYENRITFNDPKSEIPEPGTLAATLTTGNSVAFIRDGTTYRYARDSDIVFNEDQVFDTYENIAAGSCNGGTDMRGVMTHEIGHSLGLGHSCEEGEPCSVERLRDATMFWSGGPCEIGAADINEDDIEGFTALYGPYASFRCSNELNPGDPGTTVYGEVDSAIKCVIDSEVASEITNVSWAWGDGESSEGLSVKHAYAEPGNYSVQVAVAGEREECGPDGWNYQFRRVGYVTVCGLPEPVFTWEHIDGLTYQLLNETDVSVYGCVYDIQWDIFEAGSDTPIATLSAWEPQFTFPEIGDYRVTMNLGGPVGTGAAELDMDVRNARGNGYGCSSTGLAGGSLAGLFGLLAVFGLRRRRA